MGRQGVEGLVCTLSLPGVVVALGACGPQEQGGAKGGVVGGLEREGPGGTALSSEGARPGGGGGVSARVASEEGFWGV